MRKITLMFLLFFIMISVNRAVGEGSPFVRYPALNHDGTRIAFCYQGDIWVSATDGSQVKRITIHKAYEYMPLWSSDSKKIAFLSNRFGNYDIFVVNAEGGIPKQLTFHSSGDYLTQWAPDGNLLFTSNRVFRQVEWDSEIHYVSPIGGTPSRLLDAVGDMAVMSPDKRFIAFVRGSCRLTREAYQGSANRELWLYQRTDKSYKKLTDFAGHDFYPRWGQKGKLYYLSAKSGRYNIHYLNLDNNGNVTGNGQVTFFKDRGIRYFNISGNYKNLVIEKDTSIYFMNTSDKSPRLVQVKLAADYRFDPREYKTLTSNASEYAVSPDGKFMAFVARGEVFITQVKKERSRTVNLSDHPYRDQDVIWINNNAILYTSDRAGQNDIYLVKPLAKKNLFKTFKLKTVRLTETVADETNLVISPDRKQLAYLRGNGELVIAEISSQGTLANEKVLLKGWAKPEDVSWSPDSKWLAYSKPDLDYNDEIYIQPANNSQKPINVSMHPRFDSSPVWSPDGSKLAFISDRNNGDNDIWFVWLSKSDWEKSKLDWQELEDETVKEKPLKAKTAAKKKEETKIKPVKIDIKNLYRRMVQVTSLPGNEAALAISKDGKTFYFSALAPATKKRDLFSIQWDGTKSKAVTKGGQNPSKVKLGSSGKYLYLVKSKGSLARIDVKTNKMEFISFSAKMVVDHTKEKEQIFNEATRTLTNGFYDPNFHGQNWPELIRVYRNMVLKTSTKQDFRDIFNVMLGQINASHMGLHGSNRAQIPRQVTGLLGVEIKPLAQAVEVIRVVPDSPADYLSSKLYPGDIILSVNGRDLTALTNFYSLLINKANEKILLELKNKAGKHREVIIRPVSSLRDKLYDEWVMARKKLTEKYSQGKLGYLHIRGMSMPSFEKFERELTASGLGKQGIVVDVRYNGGGWTTDYLMAVLNVKQHAYTIPRGAASDLDKEHENFRKHYAFGERLPFAAWVKPAIALCNASSYSNAEIFSHAFKNLKIGKLVGVPTFGAVISTGGKRLIDGSWVRLPLRGWFALATDKNMDFFPAVPDHIVDNSPDSKARGVDEQLKKAVQVLMQEIAKK